MSKNCLVTKLKGSISDVTIPKLGDLILTRSGSTASKINFEVDADYKANTIRILNGYLSSDGTVGGSLGKEATVKGCFVVAPEGTKIYIENKYRLRQLVLAANVKDFKLSDLKYCKELAILNCINNNSIIGVESDLYELTNINTLNISNALNIHIDYVTLVQGLLANGSSKTTFGNLGSIFDSNGSGTLDWNNKDINGFRRAGNFYNLKCVVTNANKMYFASTSAPNDTTNYRRFFTYGYTAEEVTAMQADGQPFYGALSVDRTDA